MHWMVLAVSAFLLSLAGVWALRRWVERRGLLDVPNERSLHASPTPRGGGLAIAVITLGGMCLWGLLCSGAPWTEWRAYAAGAGLVALVSWWDDLRSVPAPVRLAAHGLAAGWIVWCGGYWHEWDLPFGQTVSLGGWGILLSLLWVVGLTNAYNFMDGIDGLAGVQAVAAGLGWAGLGWFGGQPLVSALGLLVAGSSLGFLVHNWPPARIFMGDVGSAFLGFTFGVLPLLFYAHAIQLEEARRAPLAGILVVWPFVFDACFTFLRRAFKGENVFAAHRSHLYQRLVLAGRSHRFVSLVYLALATAGVLLALAWFAKLEGSAAAVAVGIPGMALGLWGFVIREERKPALLSITKETNEANQ